MPHVADLALFRLRNTEAFDARLRGNEPSCQAIRALQRAELLLPSSDLSPTQQALASVALLQKNDFSSCFLIVKSPFRVPHSPTLKSVT